MKRLAGLLLAGTIVGGPALALSAIPSQAADLGTPVNPGPYKAIAAAAPIPYTWTGLYIGVFGGYSWDTNSMGLTSADKNFAGLQTANIVPGSVTTDPRGPVIGGTLGYNYQVSGPLVVGVEADWGWANIQGSGNAVGNIGPYGYSPSSYTPSSYIPEIYTSSSPTTLSVTDETINNGTFTWTTFSYTDAPNAPSTTSTNPPAGWVTGGPNLQFKSLGGNQFAVTNFVNGTYTTTTYTEGTSTTSATAPGWWNSASKQTVQALFGPYIPSTYTPSSYIPSSYTPSSYTPGSFITSHNQSLSNIGTFRARAGWAIKPDLLLYGTGGLAWGSWSASSTVTGTGGAQGIGWAGGGSGTAVGWAAGFGAEYAISTNWSAKAEMLWYDLGSKSYAVTPVNAASAAISSGSNATAEFRGIMPRLGLNYKF
jgi:opacity protein-like surface antigen